MTDEEMVFEELSWGTGAALFEVFLEPTCPHSGRAFGKLMPLLEEVGDENLTVRIWLNSQPWHTFSSVVSRAVLAASGTEAGRQGAFEVLQAVYAHREEYLLEGHCGGPNLEASPADILNRIKAHSGLDLRQAFERKAVTDVMKRHARYARQNGIHGTPTFMIGGLVNDRISSGDDASAWIAQIGVPGR